MMHRKEPAMQYCGLDMGKKSSAFCVMNGKREILGEGFVRNRPEQMAKTFMKREKTRFVIEASTKAFWMADVIRDIGHEAVVVDPGRTKAIGASMIKHDKLDARVLATLGAADLLAKVDQPTAAERLARMTVVARDGLVRSRVKLVQLVRSMLDSEGIELKSCSLSVFRREVRSIAGKIPAGMAEAIAPVLRTIDTLTEEIEICDARLKESMAEDPTAQLLMTAPGIGPVAAACFLFAIRDPGRFKTGREVGAYLGLVPSLYQSGETYRRGRITKHGNRQARWALTMAANVLLSNVKKPSALRMWGLALAKKHGRKKAVVAMARKLAAILWSMWRRNRSFEPRLALAA